MKIQFKITYLFIALCLITAILTNLGKDESVFHYVLIIDPHDARWTTIWKTQGWRLVTPIFLHFGWLHLIFNLTSFDMMGKMIERNKSSLFLLLFILVLAILSNLAEFFFHHHNFYFGGMSGVIYGLFAYNWMQQRYNPRYDSNPLSKSAIRIMMIWYILCWTPLLGRSIANYAHTAGFIAGLFYGLFEIKCLNRLFKK